MSRFQESSVLTIKSFVFQAQQRFARLVKSCVINTGVQSDTHRAKMCDVGKETDFKAQTMGKHKTCV